MKAKSTTSRSGGIKIALITQILITTLPRLLEAHWTQNTKRIDATFIQKINNRELTAANSTLHSIAINIFGSAYAITKDVNKTKLISYLRLFSEVGPLKSETAFVVNIVCLSEFHAFIITKINNKKVIYNLVVRPDTDPSTLVFIDEERYRGDLKDIPNLNNVYTARMAHKDDRLIAVFNQGMQLFQYKHSFDPNSPYPPIPILNVERDYYKLEEENGKIFDGILLREGNRYTLLARHYLGDSGVSRARLGVMSFHIDYQFNNESRPVARFQDFRREDKLSLEKDFRMAESGIQQGDGVWNEMMYSRTVYFVNGLSFGWALFDHRQMVMFGVALRRNGDNEISRLGGLTSVPRTTFVLVVAEFKGSNDTTEWEAGTRGKIYIYADVKAKKMVLVPELELVDIIVENWDIRFGDFLVANERGEVLMAAGIGVAADITYVGAIYNVVCCGAGTVAYRTKDSADKFECRRFSISEPNNCKTILDPISMGCSSCHTSFDGVSYQLIDAPNYLHPFRKVCRRKDVQCSPPSYLAPGGKTCYNCEAKFPNCAICLDFTEQCNECKPGFGRRDDEIPSCYDCTLVDPNCVICEDNEYGEDMSCRGCKKDFFLGRDSKCHSCSEGCTKCTRYVGCTECLPEFTLKTLQNEGFCSNECPQETHYLDGRECKRCISKSNPMCRKCKRDTGECYECAEGYNPDPFSTNGLCKKVCNNKTHYWSGYPLNRCLECDFKKLGEGCLGCEEKTGKCSKCKNGYKILEGSNVCTEVCRRTEYRPGGGVGSRNNSCVRCDSLESNYGCSECKDGSGICVQCKSGYNLTKNNNCAKSCGEGAYWGGKTEDRCLLCQKKSKGCSECEDVTGRCKNCKEGYFLGLSGVCQKNCTKNQYWKEGDETVCLDCQNQTEFCSECDTVTGACEKCFGGFDLLKGACILTLTCPQPAQYWSSKQKRCIDCSANCLRCSTFVGSCLECSENFTLSENEVKGCLAPKEDPKDFASILEAYFNRIELNIEIYFDQKINESNTPKTVKEIKQADFLLPNGTLYHIPATLLAPRNNKLSFKLELPIDEANQAKISLTASTGHIGANHQSVGPNLKKNKNNKNKNRRVLNQEAGDSELIIVVENVSFYKSEGNSFYKYLGKAVYLAGIGIAFFTLIFAPPLSFMLFHFLNTIWVLGFIDPDFPGNLRLLTDQFDMAFFDLLPNPFKSNKESENNQKMCQMKPILHSKNQTCQIMQSQSGGVITVMIGLVLLKIIYYFGRKIFSSKKEKSQEMTKENRPERTESQNGDKNTKNSKFLIQIKEIVQEEIRSFQFLRRGFLMVVFLAVQPQTLTQSLITIRYSLNFSTAKN